MNEHKEFDIVKDCSNFLKKMEKLKLYMIKFNKDGIIKSKVYPLDCVIKDENQ